MIYCLWIEWQVFPFADKINKLQKNKQKYLSYNNHPQTENTWGDEACSWDLKDNITFKQPCQLTLVCSPAVALAHRKGPRHRRNIRANSLRLYCYFTETLPSKNKNINNIFIYLQIIFCLSSGAVYDKTVFSALFFFFIFLSFSKRVVWYKTVFTAVMFVFSSKRKFGRFPHFL